MRLWGINWSFYHFQEFWISLKRVNVQKACKSLLFFKGSLFLGLHLHRLRLNWIILKKLVPKSRRNAIMTWVGAFFPLDVWKSMRLIIKKLSSGNFVGSKRFQHKYFWLYLWDLGFFIFLFLFYKIFLLSTVFSDCYCLRTRAIIMNFLFFLLMFWRGSLPAWRGSTVRQFILR